MPELPEVETIRRQLESVLVGKVLESVEVLNEKSFFGDKDKLVGMEVVGVRRRGKGLVVDLVKLKNKGSNGSRLCSNREEKDERVSLVIHLKMTGQLIYDFDNKSNNKSINRLVGGHPTEDFVQKLPSKHTRLIIKFKKQKVKSNEDKMIQDLGSVNNADLSTSQLMRGSPLAGESDLSGLLYFNDQRKFGWVKLVKTEDVEKLDFVSKLGPEPWVMTYEDFYNGLQKSRMSVKVRIMDQEFVAGVGNIYANDALWEAKIDPNRKANSLSKDEISLLLEKIKMVLEEGIYYGGATAPDKKYMDLSGMGGKYQNYFRVYEREGELCKRGGCEGVIRKMKLGGRGTYWCDNCQK